MIPLRKIKFEKINFVMNIILFILLVGMSIAIYSLREKQHEIQEKCGL